jgi:probable rRNA maturation factor
VLAFPLGASGEVVVNRDAVATQARRYGWPVAFEYARLTLHGFLHLAGYDHARSPGRVRMERRERRILANLFPRLRTHPTVKQHLTSA